MQSGFAWLPPADPGCRITVAIPAKNEAALIERTLAAFSAQRALDGTPLPADAFELIVFANDCHDDTAACVRDVARRAGRRAIYVVEAELPVQHANVGMARKLVMDFAAARQRARDARDGIVASVDADTIVDAEWIAWLAYEMRGAEAVAGHVTIGEADLAAMQAPQRVLYARELAFRRAIADLEACLDPRPEDPPPRHASFVGASFAVREDVYLAAGGIVPLPRLEDLAFSEALRRIDARIRHSLRVRATTSARERPRVEGGFGTFVADLAERGRRRDTFYVAPAASWLETFTTRGALRRIWHGAGSASDAEIVSMTFGLSPKLWRPLVDVSLPFGTVYARIEACAARTRRYYAPVPVEEAIAALRAATTSLNPATPTRTSAASGAG
jgi:hypothetical protein